MPDDLEGKFLRVSQADGLIHTSVRSMVGALSGEGLVAVQFGKAKHIIVTGEARRLAMMLLDAATTAELEARVLRMGERHVGQGCGPVLLTWLNEEAERERERADGQSG